jgi:hypothetical protein
MLELPVWNESERQECIDEFIERTREQVGAEIDAERWHSQVNADQADVWVNGMGDANPRWDPHSPGDEVHPTYVVSIASPGMVFGAPMSTPLENLIGRLEVEWDEPLRLGDSDLNGIVSLDDVTHKERGDKSYVFLTGTGEYRRGEERIAEASTTLIRTPVEGLQEERDIYEYSDDELDEIQSLYESELDRIAGEPPTPEIDDLTEGDELPTIVRGPLTVADMVSWNAAIGPSYGAHLHNYVERKEAPDGTVANPKTGWVQKDSHQHEDFLLAEQRGMPLPFANGENMWALTAPLVTNWMGSDGFLKRHTTELEKPYFYGDILHLDGEIVGLDGFDASVTVEWEAINPLDEAVITGSSTVLL